MSRCELSGKDVVVKNLVSHSNIKTKSRAYPNVRKKRLYSKALKRFFPFKLAASTVKTLDRKGFDSYILSQEDKKLSKRALSVKNELRRVLNRKKGERRDQGQS